MMSYNKPGKYVAICNKPDFDGHVVKVFDLPDTTDMNSGAFYGHKQVSALTYFKSFVEAEAAVEAVYPAAIFMPAALALLNQPPVIEVSEG